MQASHGSVFPKERLGAEGSEENDQLKEIGGLGSQTFGLFFYKLEDLTKQKE